jgi:hypothetical protein
MLSRVHISAGVLGRLAVGAGAALAVSLPFQANAATPITDQYGATGTSPNSATWLESINETYGLSHPTPVTDQYAITSEPNISVWLEAIKGQYKYSDVQHPTPVTDQYGVTGTSPNSATWYENMKEQYGIVGPR